MKLHSYPKGVNCYLMLKNSHNPLAFKLIQCLNTAMAETGVKEDSDSYQVVGDIVYRMMYAAVNGGKIKVKTEDDKGMSFVAGTYERFIKEVGSVDWSELENL